MLKVTWVFEVFLLLGDTCNIGRICTQTDVTKKKRNGVGGFKD